jgi:hypothetical protein
MVNFFIAGLVKDDEKETVGGLGTIDKTGNYREWLHVWKSFCENLRESARNKKTAGNLLILSFRIFSLQFTNYNL